MGVGISHVFASSGIPTVLVDATPELSEAARSRAIELLSRLEQAGNVGGGTTATAERHLSAAPSIADAVRGADLVVEAVVERPDVKLAVYAEIEAAAGRRGDRDEHVVHPDRGARGGAAASRTASSASTGSSRRCSSPASRSSARRRPTTQVVDMVVEALTRLGKTPVVVGDGPDSSPTGSSSRCSGRRRGSSRRASPAPEQVDEVVRSSFGFRLPFFGPFTIADMAGLDVYADIFDTLERGLGPGFSAPRSCGSTSPAASSASRRDAGSWSCPRPRPTS